MDVEKYQGIFPAFYACYDDRGEISPERVRALTRYLVEKGVKGAYVCGSSGECIYQTVAERKLVLENVMQEARGKLTIIAHVAAASTAESCELAAHAERLGVDAIASIPPIYYHVSEEAVAKYWTDISAAAPNTDFFIYNIPQLTGFNLTPALLKKMLENPRIIGVKNTSMAAMDIELFKDTGAIVFNGPDEQLASGLVAGAIGGIGGTYGAMPELYQKIYDFFQTGDLKQAAQIQIDCLHIINKLCSGHGNMYAVIKEVLRRDVDLNIGGVRAPLPDVDEGDSALVDECVSMIRTARAKYL